MKKVAFYTLGCKVNQYETEAMRELFEANGDIPVDAEDFADIYIINTCTVTGVSDKKSRQFIRRCKRKNPEAVIAVVGCYSQIAPKEVLGIEGVNLVLGTSQRTDIVKLVSDITAEDRRELVSDIMKIREFEEMTVERIESRTRAFIKIQDGCDRYCSYCIIPYARGPVRSRNPESVLTEVRRLADRGYGEVVLTGIHVASYGKDLDEVSLMALLEAIQAVPGIHRIRLSSLEPILLTEEFIRGLSRLDKVCPHFHISLQSGSDTVLKRMNRRYTTGEYLGIVSNIRAYYPDAAITTDIIAGFPGETEEEFEETCQFVDAVRFSQVHVFGYSPREGTPAATMEHPVPPEVKQKRVDILIKKAEEHETAYIKQFVGRKMQVLVEQNVLGKNVEGLTRNYIRVFLPEGSWEPGTEIETTIVGVQGNGLIGMAEPPQEV